MFTRITIALALSLAASFAHAQGKALEPIPIPQIGATADDGWKHFIVSCFVQANKRRALGLDVAPQFSDDDGKPFDGLPLENESAHCHVASSKEVNERK